MTQEREFFRVACEFQIRIRKVEEEELQIFTAHGLRPSPYSILRTELEGQLSLLPIRDESKNLLEKAFQILINMDQRLERIEEYLEEREGDNGFKLMRYEWVHGDIGAGGFSCEVEGSHSFKSGEALLVDIILPALPDYRFVAAARAVAAEGKKLNCEFAGIHADDREYIHRFVMARERELLRARSKDR